MEKYHNPRAFPYVEEERTSIYANTPDTMLNVVTSGMTLLDYFAGQVISGAISNPTHGRFSSLEIVQYAYNLAHLMLKERQNYL